MTTEQALDRRWKYPAVPSIVRREIQRPDRGIVRALANHPVNDVADIVGGLYTARDLRPLYSPMAAVAGPSLTVRCPPGDNLGVKLALEMVQPGDVLVVDAQGFDSWCLGGFQMLARAIRERGLAGLIVHGAYRDSLEAREAGFPIYATAQSARSGPKIGPFEINVPACCGGVIVQPGDIACASEDGVAFVPRAHADAVVDRLTAPPPAKPPQAANAYAAYLQGLRDAGLVDEQD